MIMLCAFKESAYFCLVVFCAFICSSCYTFTGASVPQHWNTIFVPLFEDESSYGQPALREKATNQFIEKLQRDNTLKLGERNTASVELRGKILSVVADQPIALSQGVTASRLRVEVKLSVLLYDNVLKKQAWTKTFSATGDYAPSGGTAEREAGMQQAIDKLTDDLLLETISAW
jgi:hypothetical protein